MSTFVLSVERLRTGTWIARPACALGTCGGYPFPWDIAADSDREQAVRRFKMAHHQHLSNYDNIEVVYD